MENSDQLYQAVKDAKSVLRGVESKLLSNDLWLYSLEFAIFGLISLLLVTFLIYKGKDPWSCIRCIGTITIIVMAGLLVLGGYSPDQISAVIGLFGTVAGYLLGKADSNN